MGKQIMLSFLICLVVQTVCFSQKGSKLVYIIDQIQLHPETEGYLGDISADDIF